MFTIFAVVSTISQPVPDVESCCSLPSVVTETTNSFNITTTNETLEAQIASPTTVQGKNPKENYRIKTPTYCTCKKKTKGQCAQCQIRELKMLVKEKDQQLKIVRSYQVKATLEINKLKSKLKEQNKKLIFTSKQLERMRQSVSMLW